MTTDPKPTPQEIRARLDELGVADLPRLLAAVRAMANLADALDQFDGSSRVAAEQIRNYLAGALSESSPTEPEQSR